MKKEKPLVRGKRVSHYENGNPKYKYFSAVSNKELQKKMAKWELEKDKPKDIIFKDYADKWFWSIEPTLADRTSNDYKIIMNKLIERFGDINMENIDTLEAQNYLNELNTQAFAKSTIKHRRDVLRNIFDYCISKRVLNHNPILYTVIPKTAKTKKIKPANINEIDVICKSLDKPFALFALLLCFTGLRKSEALALTWKDIDFKNKTLKVNKKLVYQSQNPKLENTLKNGDDERTQIIPDILIVVLEKVKKTSQSKLLFPSNLNNEKYMTKSDAEHSWKKYCDSVGININMHQLRHSYATILNKAGLDVKKAQVLLGHKDIKVTLNIYTEIEKEQFDTARKQINKYISKKVAPNPKHVENA